MIFKCKMCGGQLDIIDGATVCTCDYCGTEQTLPRLDSDKKQNLYDRANHFRRNNDYDKAMSIYEQILNEDNTDAESYWSLVICKYGIEYVEDPTSHKRIPTVNRAQYTSIFDDEDYKSALKYADTLQKTIYKREAKTINGIQKGILAISNAEEPFDVFICYKETDESGRRTKDSVYANDLYNLLEQEGFKVFFARITLEDKLGQEYEPYIFAALNSAKAMVVLGTKPEYFNAVWVKNEWSRYLALIKKGENKVLIPAYKDMDPYDLPEEFSHLQAQDMSKLGFMQDLIRGIKKIIGTKEPQSIEKETVVVQQVANSGNVSALIKRGNMALDDGDWAKADDFFEEVLNQDAENGEAYIGKLLAREECNNIKELEKKYCKKNDDCSISKYQDRLACEVDEKHINEQIRQKKIAGYLEEDEIRAIYKYDLTYHSEFESRMREKDEQLTEIQSDKLFNRCLQYATGDTKKSIEDVLSSLKKELEYRINIAKKSDENNVKEIKSKYRNFVKNEADVKLKKLYEEALEHQKQDAITKEQLVEEFNKAIKKEDYVYLKTQFSKIINYNSDEVSEYIARCDEKIKFFEEFQLAEKKAKEEAEKEIAWAERELVKMYKKLDKEKKNRKMWGIFFAVFIVGMFAFAKFMMGELGYSLGKILSIAWKQFLFEGIIGILVVRCIVKSNKEIKCVKLKIHELESQRNSYKGR